MKKPFKEYGRYGSVGIELIASIALGYYGGRWLDTRFHAHGWLTGIGFFIGVYAGFRALFLTASKMQRDIEQAEADDKPEDVAPPISKREKLSEREHQPDKKDPPRD